MARLFMVDMRCPKCNRILKGGQNDEVVWLSQVPKIDKCKWCGCELVVKEVEARLSVVSAGLRKEGYNHYSYDTKKEVTRG